LHCKIAWQLKQRQGHEQFAQELERYVNSRTEKRISKRVVSINEPQGDLRSTSVPFISQKLD